MRGQTKSPANHQAPAGQAAPLAAPSFRPRQALRPRPLAKGSCLERPPSRSRQAARVHARVVDAPCRGDDRDRRHRLDGGVRRRSSVAVLGVEARRSGVQGGGRLCRPDHILRHVDQHRAHHRDLGHGVARARRRRQAARTAPCCVRAHHYRRLLRRDGCGDVPVARLDPDDGFARAWRVGRGRLEVHRHQHSGECAARGRHDVFGSAARGRRRAPGDVCDAVRRDRNGLSRSAAHFRPRARSLWRRLGDRPLSSHPARGRLARRGRRARSRRAAETQRRARRFRPDHGDRISGDHGQYGRAGQFGLYAQDLLRFRRAGDRRFGRSSIA